MPYSHYSGDHRATFRFGYEYGIMKESNFGKPVVSTNNPVSGRGQGTIPFIAAIRNGPIHRLMWNIRDGPLENLWEGEVQGEKK